jgi:steroid Delta-isomerase
VSAVLVPAVPARHADARVARVIAYFEALQPADVARVHEVYAPDARFKDPFQDVQGTTAIEGVYRHMFEALDGPHFKVRDAVAQGDQAFLAWDFHFRMKRFDRAPQVIRGGTHLHFGPDGRIAVHRDYWDAAEELYEKLPVLGALMRWLKRRANS